SHLPRHPLLQNLQNGRHPSFWRFAQQQMHVIRHDHVTHQQKLEFRADFCKDFDEQIPCPDRLQITAAVVTAKSNKVKGFLTVMTVQALRHRKRAARPTLANPTRKGRPPSCTYSAVNYGNGILSSHRAV